MDTIYFIEQGKWVELTGQLDAKNTDGTEAVNVVGNSETTSLAGTISSMSVYEATINAGSAPTRGGTKELDVVLTSPITLDYEDIISAVPDIT